MDSYLQSQQNDNAHWSLFSLLPILVLASVGGCRSNEELKSPAISVDTGLSTAFELSFVVETIEKRRLGCATLLYAHSDFFYVATSIGLIAESNIRLVSWSVENDGQKFERMDYTDFRIVASEPRLKLAILRVEGTHSKQPATFANTELHMFQREFAAYTVRLSTPRPLQAFSVNASGLAQARASESLPPAEFFNFWGSQNYNMLGSPLVTQQGELAAVAVGNFLGCTVYCPAAEIKKLMALTDLEIEN